MMTMTTTDAQLLTLETFRAERDGCLAYLVVDEASRAGLVIDPRLDQVDEILATVTARGICLGYVLDTHTHADHLSGVRRLAQRTGATVLAHAASKIKWGGARRVRGRDDLRARHEDREGHRRTGSHTRLVRASGRRPSLHGRRPLCRRGRPHRLHGRERFRSLRYPPDLRGPSGGHGGPSRPRLRRSAGDHHRRGEGAQSALARARPGRTS